MSKIFGLVSLIGGVIIISMTIERAFLSKTLVIEEGLVLFVIGGLLVWLGIEELSHDNNRKLH